MSRKTVEAGLVRLRLSPCGGPRHASRRVLLAALALLLISASGCAIARTADANLQGTVVVAGSTALQPLVQAAASNFMSQHPGVRIEVRAGGSVAGLNAVNAHQADIGDSDLYADPALYPDPDLTDHLICVVPFVVIVNSKVPVSSVTSDQLTAIFTRGGITNWSQIGGPNLPIVPIIRSTNSGTRVTFDSYVLGSHAEQGKAADPDTSVGVVSAVAATPGAIGYVEEPSVNGTVRTLSIDGASPTSATIQSGHYTFWSFEHMYTLGTPSPAASAFLTFMVSQRVQAVAQTSGYVNLTTVIGSRGGPNRLAAALPAGADLSADLPSQQARDEEWLHA